MYRPPSPALAGFRPGQPWRRPRPGLGALLAGAGARAQAKARPTPTEALRARRRRPCAVPAAAGAGAARPRPGRGAGLPHRRRRVGVAVLCGLPPVRAGARAAAVCGQIEIVNGRFSDGPHTAVLCGRARPDVLESSHQGWSGTGAERCGLSLRREGLGPSGHWCMKECSPMSHGAPAADPGQADAAPERSLHRLLPSIAHSSGWLPGMTRL